MMKSIGSHGQQKVVRRAAALAMFVVFFCQRSQQECSSIDPAFDPEVCKVLLESHDAWQVLPLSVRKDFAGANLRVVRDGFKKHLILVYSGWSRPISHTEPFDYELARACSHALGNDIAFEKVGSVTRGTSARSTDLDYQVRRSPNSKQAGEPFTFTDKQKVAQNLGKLHIVIGPVTIGTKAIKFQLIGPSRTHVDLVLWSNEPDDFPNLRGGKDFCKNSDRINSFLKRTHAARDAIVAYKEFGPGGPGVFFREANASSTSDRPDGILLEAIAWRLSKTCPFPLTTLPDNSQSEPIPMERRSDMMWEESLMFFAYFWTMLRKWEESPFASDLKLDLEMFPNRTKWEEHIRSFELARRTMPFEEWCYHILALNLAFKAEETWNKEDGPLGAHVKRELWEFFPFKQWLMDDD